MSDGESAFYKRMQAACVGMQRCPKCDVTWSAADTGICPVCKMSPSSYPVVTSAVHSSHKMQKHGPNMAIECYVCGLNLRTPYNRLGEPCVGSTAVPQPAPTDPFPGNRKEYPLFTGLLQYFPLALAEVARTSYIANEQHNPGEPMHWDQSKSVGKGDELLRHLVDGVKTPIDTDGAYHWGKACWRMLEMFERFLMAERGQ